MERGPSQLASEQSQRAGWLQHGWERLHPLVTSRLWRGPVRQRRCQIDGTVNRGCHTDCDAESPQDLLLVVPMSDGLTALASRANQAAEQKVASHFAFGIQC